MQIIKDLLPKSWQEDLLDSLKDVTWVHQKGTSYKTGEGTFIQGMDVFVDENTVDSVQFVHYAMLGPERSFMFAYLKPIMYMIEERIGKKIKLLHRIKINHQAPIPNFTTDNYNIPHSDDANPLLWSLIYYVNDSDGDTVMFNERYNYDWAIKKLTIAERVTPEAGKAILFPASQFHASSNPINTPNRYVINFVFEVEQ